MLIWYNKCGTKRKATYSRGIVWYSCGFLGVWGREGKVDSE
jgi:hypothetical protein